ncbi:MAG: prepilin-type N-terminal cleavage/methylation domain-containing protein [Actinomycetia bacterium]|nr:prepilin-type N-terminal cleavage/methylation domain-containing protein [Actinomycetes bacterium]
MGSRARPDARRTADRRLRSQAGFTLVEMLVGIALSVILIGPVGAWLVLIFTSQAPAAAGFTDAGQSRLLNTYVTRDVSSAELITDESDDLKACTGAEVDQVLLNIYDLGDSKQFVVYGTGSGGSSLMRWTCDLTAAHNVIDQTEIIRGATTITAGCDSDCGRVTVEATLESGHETSVTASRRASAAALLGFGGTQRPVAIISQESRTERSKDGPLTVELSAAQSWDPDSTDPLLFAWSIDGPANAGLSATTGETTTASFATASDAEYVVTLRATDESGNVGTASQRVLLTNQDPVIDTRECTAVGRTVSCTATAHDPDASATPQLLWSYPVDDAGGVGTQGGGNASFDIPVDVTAATVSVTVTATDVEGGADVSSVDVAIGTPASGPIAISPAPKASGNGLLQLVASTESDVSVTFSTDADNFAGWELRPLGSTVVLAESDQSVWAHEFLAGDSGRFTIARIPVNAASPVETTDFRINAPPTASFDDPSTTSPAPQTLTFVDTSGDDFGIQSRRWAFDAASPAGAGFSGSGTPAPATFTNPGSYLVVLTVTDADGLESTASRFVRVGGTPAQPAPPTWVGDTVFFEPLAGATGYRVTFAYEGFEEDGTTPCVRPIDRWVAATGPFEVRDVGNPCPVPSRTTASLAVRANAAIGPASIGVERP